VVSSNQLFFSKDRTYDDMACEIITVFYAYVDKDKPD